MADPGKTPEAAIPWDFSRDDADPVPGQSDDGPGPSLSEDNPEPGENDDGPVPDENNGDQKHLHGEWSDMTCRECGARDHFTRNCDKVREDDQTSFARGRGRDRDRDRDRGRDRGCFNCGQEGHTKSECPQQQVDTEQGCFGCGELGHFKSECPNRRQFGACFNCGEEGHSKAECPKPRVFKGVCHTCQQEGHPAALCPEKPADYCKNCLSEGHQAKDCTSNRKFDLNDIADKLPEEAWAMMKEASDERDINDFREAFKIYSKAVPTATYDDIEQKMRDEGFNIYLIALEKEREDFITLIDLQGRLDRTYVVRFSLSDKPLRANLAERWPTDAADNLERLKDTGQPYDRHVMHCRNCGGMGHGSRACKEERTEYERVEIKCINCGGTGHRVRDCTEERKSKGGCRNCGADGHEARDCLEPRSASGIECRICNEMGHFAKECPQASQRGERGPRTCRNCGSEDHIARECDQPRDPATMTCRNCDQVGHAARECPEPKDWSRVKCNRCNEMGHTVRRCPQPEEGGFDAFEPAFGERDERFHGEDDGWKETGSQLEDQQW